MSNRKPEYLLEDILNSAEKILSYTKDITFDEFVSIDWFRIRGFRNRIVHDYFGIDHEIVWKIKEDQLHTLILQIQNILNNLK